MAVECVCTHALARLLADEKAKRLIRPAVPRQMRAATADINEKTKLDGTHRYSHHTPMSARSWALLNAKIAPDGKRLGHLLGKALTHSCQGATP